MLFFSYAYKIEDVINAVLKICDELKIEDLTPKKLQKLLYYLHAWYLYEYSGKRLTKEEIQAWRHGPVIPKVYYDYKKYGGCPIPIASSIDFPTNLVNQKEFFKKIIDKYVKKSANELEDLTHQELPWKNARVGLSDWQSSSRKITNKDMLLFCKKSELAKKSKNIS